MTSRSELPWSERLRRDLQSLRDRAPRLSRSDGALGPRCEQCDQQSVIALLPAEDLPHWLVHEVAGIVGGIRLELTWEMLDRPLGDGTVGGCLSGAGNIPSAERTPEMRRAEQIMFDHHRLVELWLREEAPALAEWVARLRKAGGRVSADMRISARHIERMVFASPDALWFEVCQEWGRRIAPVPVRRTPELRRSIDGLLLPDWLTDDERRTLVRSAEWVVEERRRARMREMVIVLRQITDPRQRGEDMFIAEQETVQEAIELGAELQASIAAQQSDVGIALAAVMHSAANAIW